MIPARVEPARRVRIAVPTYSGSLFEEMQRSLAAGLLRLKDAGIEVEEVDILAGCCYLDHARNVLAARFLNGTATDLIFLDADVGFEGESLLRLCRRRRPLVAGIYPKKMDEPEYPVGVIGGEVWADKEGLVDCWMAPTGFMRINRTVFGALEVPRYRHPGLDLIGAYFRCAVRDDTYWGEDVEFCRLVREAGGHVHAFAEMNFTHSSPTKVYRGNWGKHLLSQLSKEAA
ncbi:MAG: hypothetical protein JSR91_00230 [Proteobacteria bacterium]|nr:hypothetical protein [Pseudomonadota bacterium]